MKPVYHKLYVGTLAAIVLAVLGLLIYSGYSYYDTPLEERFFHENHTVLRPAGTWGHGFGIAGSLSMIIGILIYMARKRLRTMARWGLLKHWLEFHIFLCTLGPILVLFHTSFKFGGIVAVSFWSMVAVFLSGIIGRFIYIQIPRTIEGRELSLNEVRELNAGIAAILNQNYRFDEESYRLIMEDENRTISKVREVLRKNKLTRKESRQVVSLVKQDISLKRRIGRLQLMQKLFRYWHVVHLPFAIVMLIIMLIHVGVTILFGYRWIF